MRPPCRGPRSSAAAARELIAQRAGPEDQPYRLSPEAPGHESDHLRGSVIEPLRVIKHAQQRLLGRCLREQAQHGKADQEPVRNRPGIQAERDAQRVGLRSGTAASRSSSGAHS